ncbi:hypothetical protein JZ751_017155 [Albula glossodonta]|uniref:Uncharacterized protein n=1 Tax=Albula glossodonta TaxID=121402 RepID=A0A8T2NP69_9TELE|nr:hypothetical protein JZ751_017155 [Albula glossodonta]
MYGPNRFAFGPHSEKTHWVLCPEMEWPEYRLLRPLQSTVMGAKGGRTHGSMAGVEGGAYSGHWAAAVAVCLEEGGFTCTSCVSARMGGDRKPSPCLQPSLYYVTVSPEHSFPCSVDKEQSSHPVHSGHMTPVFSHHILFCQPSHPVLSGHMTPVFTITSCSVRSHDPSVQPSHPVLVQPSHPALSGHMTPVFSHHILFVKIT